MPSSQTAKTRPAASSKSHVTSRLLAASLAGFAAWMTAGSAEAQASLVNSRAGCACPSTSAAVYAPPQDPSACLNIYGPGTVLCEYARLPYTGYNLIGKYSSAWKKRKVIYVSTNKDGGKVAVSGTVVTPINFSVSEIVAYAPSTVGLADKCAQSATIDNNVTLSVSEGGISRILDTRRAVVVPDYEGLGTTGNHPYLDGISAGHVTLDLLRAAGGLANMNVVGAPEVKYFMVGNSQGAQAVAWAAQMKPTYAPEVPLAGVIGVATPANLAKSLAAVVSRYDANGNVAPTGTLSIGATLVPFALQGATYYTPYTEAEVFGTLTGTNAEAWKSSALRNCTYENLGWAFTDPLSIWHPVPAFFTPSAPEAGALGAAVAPGQSCQKFDHFDHLGDR